ncbi:quinol:cytochrome C oxidoreductase [Arachidicoccus ginsenosidimutans]|uniref:quinol:cytochrome C oxidoreductase n=1 Tax=Arachidicoccus sp. BS20 TaxID=1850526 RepID=UPI0007F0C809|nr:quinol:cytochrome C oxidoreductase [Arachidicoccus sp. BS20]ANI90222.1 quinol:cytochrome C oxidoreductase [Arachidicoccus sp. BS20]
MASIKTQFEIPAKMKTWSYGLMAVGIVAFLIGLFTKGMSADVYDRQVFWGTIMYNAIFFLLITNVAMFFICALTIGMGGWQTALRRVPEAISATVPVFGTIAGVLLIGIVISNLHIYQWTDMEKVKEDMISSRIHGFLNPWFFSLWTIATIGLWIMLGARMRKLSAEADVENMGLEKGQSFIWRNTVTASMFIAWFGLTAGCVTPWFWQMSLNIHWGSTMYSWYTFASSFVGGLALITLFFIYLKNKGYLELANQEHLHDLGKFLFAFSIFWTYIWFAQYMLIWYANIPEETIYFKHRVQGEYKGVFFLNLVINFVCPILILMSRPAKRNYTLVTFMAVLLLFGHWLDFYQMIMGSISPIKITLGWLDFGILAFFVGILIFCVGRALTKRPLVPKYHPFLKESIIHHT